MSKRADLEAMVKGHYAAVYGFCLRVLRSSEPARDATQQVFLEAIRDFDSYAGRGSLRAWLHGIAYRRCIDVIRAARRWDGIEGDDALDEVSSGGATPADPLTDDQLRAALEHCVSRLPSEMRATLLLRFTTGDSFPALAERLGATSAALHARVARGLQLLRKCMERKGWANE